MGKRQRSTQGSLFIPTASLARSSSHAFYERLNQVLAKDGFDEFVERLCAPFYVERKGRPGIPPGILPHAPGGLADIYRSAAPRSSNGGLPTRITTPVVAASASARTRQHPQASADPRRWIQPESDHV